MVRSDDDDRVFVRTRWGTSRYTANPRNPIGRGLIVGALVVVVVGMYLVRRSEVRGASNDWSGSALRNAVTAVSARPASSSDLRFGSPIAAGTYEEGLRMDIADAAHRSEDGLDVMSTSESPESAELDGNARQVDYTVTADGTDTAFCLDVRAPKGEPDTGGDSVTISVGEGECRAP